MSESQEMIGSELDGYRIEAVLGRGGMGVVYRATDSRLGRKVALKVLPPEFGNDPTYRSRFLRESRIAASLDHPGVIPIYEAGDADGQLYIAMRHVEGTDLAALLRTEGALAPERALALTGQLAAALDAAHARGLVHRDVKPSNALVVRTSEEAEHVYLCDFGVSKDATADEALTETGGVVGTVRYMPPEVIKGGPATPSSDLYSLGCLLFECLTGEPPFSGPSDAAVIYGHLEDPPPRVSARRPPLPRALDDVVARALDKDPERRWASGAELAGAARAALGGTAPKRVRARRRRRAPSRRAVRAGLGLGVLTAVGAAAAVLTSGDEPGIVSVRPDSMAIIDPSEGSLLGQVELEGSPAAIAEGAGAVWVTDEDRNVVSRIDKETRTIRQTIRVGRGPVALAVDREGVWVANRQDGTVSVVSPQTNEVVHRIPVGRTVDGLCITDGTVWVASPLDYTVVRIEPHTGKRQGVIRLESQPAGLACGAGSVWASSPTVGTVTEISTAAGAATRTIQVSRGVSAMALGKGGLWVANPPDGTISRIDPQRGAVTATIPVGERDGPAHLVVTDEAMWVSSELGGTVARVDHQDARVVEKLRLGNRPQGLAEVDGALWIAVADDGTRHRGGTLEVEYGLGAASLGDLLPEMQSLTSDGLVGFPRQEATAPVVANLAEALPIPSDGGRTYAFRLRKGVRYSDGKPVLASHVAPGIQRAMQRYPGIFANIRGAGRCTPKRCDLSKGVVADDRAGTLVIRLTAPDPDLLFKLANPAAALVPPAVLKAGPLDAPPATGPYRITRFEPDRIIRLERNPRFRSWSAVARPDGFPDVIIGRLGVPRKGLIDRLLSGEIDRASGIELSFPPEALDQVRRRAPGQMRASVAPVTQFFFLNTKRPPFEDVDARRAVSFAFDRRAAAKAYGGPDAAQGTCQVLPPNFPGYRPYCPYTLPGSGGARGRPNLAEARRLVRRSGTRGMRVTVHAPNRLPPALAQVMVRTLRTLGYRADVRALPPEEHFPAVTAPDSRAQVAFFPWLADYPAPSTFFGLFACDGPVNPARFCDRRLDRMVAEAARLQLTNPGAADALWARVERRVVDRAPAVAMYNILNVDVLSSRVGNYRNVPLLGMLLDQAWVR